MFGKTREMNDMDTLQPAGDVGEFFGDEAAAEEAAHLRDFRRRVEQVEAQVNSQFTSLAAYAQIAQEQIELARAESKATTERTEQRLTSLIERERSDRIQSFTGEAPAGSAPDVVARLDALERSVAQIKHGLDECMERQRALADAITALFERKAPAPLSQPPAMPAPESAAVVDEAAVEAAGAAEPLTGPIADLSLEY
jgi:hypothetical protein